MVVAEVVMVVSRVVKSVCSHADTPTNTDLTLRTMTSEVEI